MPLRIIPPQQSSNPSAAVQLRHSAELKLDTSLTLQDLKDEMDSVPWDMDSDDETEIIEWIIVNHSNLGDCLATCWQKHAEEAAKKLFLSDLITEVKIFYPELTFVCDFLITLPVESVPPQEDGLRNIPWVWTDEQRDEYKDLRTYSLLMN